MPFIGGVPQLAAASLGVDTTVVQEANMDPVAKPVWDKVWVWGYLRLSSRR